MDLNEVENKMYLAIFGAFEDYRIYVLKLIDEIIILEKIYLILLKTLKIQT